MYELAIIILNYNTYKMTIKLLGDLLKICDPRTMIIVVDNKSTNESVEKIREFVKGRFNVELIESNENGGYAKGNNIGLRYAQGKGIEYSLIINNDIEIKVFSIIEKMIALLKFNDEIGAVSPIIENIDGTISPPKYHRKPSFFDLTLNVFGYQKERYQFDEYVNAKIYAPRGSCMLVSNKYMKTIGNLDENTFLYYEEPILAERLLAINKECWHCGNAKVIHKHAKTINTSLNKKRIANILCNSYEYYLRQYLKMGLIKTRICLIVRMIAVMR